MQVTCTPSIVSMRLPVGNSDPVTAPQASRKFEPDRRRRAGHAVDARLAVVGDAAAGGEHRDVDPRAGVDVEHANGRLAVLRRHQALLDGERADAGKHVAAVGPRIDRFLADADLGEEVVDVAPGLRRTCETIATLLVSVLPPPTPSTCSRSDAPIAPIRASSRSRSSVGSHSRRKNGPREVPARIRTQGMARFMGAMVGAAIAKVNCIFKIN